MDKASHSLGPWIVQECEIHAFAGPIAVALNTFVGKDTCEANAKLMVAAPYLLHACEEMLVARKCAYEPDATATYVMRTWENAWRRVHEAIKVALEDGFTIFPKGPPEKET